MKKVCRCIRREKKYWNSWWRLNIAKKNSLLKVKIWDNLSINSWEIWDGKLLQTRSQCIGLKNRQINAKESAMQKNTILILDIVAIWHLSILKNTKSWSLKIKNLPRYPNGNLQQKKMIKLSRNLNLLILIFWGGRIYSFWTPGEATFTLELRKICK